MEIVIDEPAAVSIGASIEELWTPSRSHSSRLSVASAHTLARTTCSTLEPLLVLAVFLCAAATSFAAGSGCSGDQKARDTWVYWAWFAMAISAPFALFVAWCAFQRRSFQSGSALHKWTWRYGVVATICAGFALMFPWLFTCFPKSLVAGCAYLLASYTYIAGKVIIGLMLEHKLRAMERPRLAWVIRCGVLGSMHLAVSWVTVYCLPRALFGQHFARMLLVVLFCSFAPPLAASVVAGLWGMLATVARAARSQRTSQRRAAVWVLLTAASFAASAAGWVTIGFLHTFLIGGEAEASRGVVFPANLFVDLLLDCVSVALFSGLVGPPLVQRLAEGAFAAINPYTAEQLQRFYAEFLVYLDEAQIKWVRCRFLRQLAASGATMPRCQDVPATEVVVGSEGFPLSRTESKRRFVVSHPWLSKEHPDPTGLKLCALVEQLDALGASNEDAVFVDYMSLPQHDGQDLDLQRLERQGNWPEPGDHPAVRTEAEEATFRRALGSMELLYSTGRTPVIVLPMAEGAAHGADYMSRGWCFLEFCLALSFGNIANADTHPPVRSLSQDAREQQADTVHGFRVAFRRTRFTYAGDADIVMRLFEQTVSKNDSTLS